MSELWAHPKVKRHMGMLRGCRIQLDCTSKLLHGSAGDGQVEARLERNEQHLAWRWCVSICQSVSPLSVLVLRADLRTPAQSLFDVTLFEKNGVLAAHANPDLVVGTSWSFAVLVFNDRTYLVVSSQATGIDYRN